MKLRTAEELKQLRKDAGLTQVNAAKLVCVTLRAWQQWEQSPDTVTSRRPPCWVFAFLNMYIFLKSKGIEYEPVE